MMFVKLTHLENGSIRAETARATIAVFDDMTESEVAAYLVERAEEAGETVRFVDEFVEQEEHIDFQRLMKRHF